MIAFLAAILLKGTMLMTAAAAVNTVMFRASAATRHFIWTLTIVGLLLLPVFSTTLPRWALAVPLAPIETSAAIDVARRAGITSAAPVTVRASATPSVSVIESPDMAGRLPWPLVLVTLYVIGVLILLGRFVVHRSVARRIVRSTTAVSDREWTSLLDDCASRIGVRQAVSLRRSLTQVMPVTAGTLAPSIVIPADADGWDEDRRRAVLLHELAHIARQDCLTQMLAALACAVYWFHPGVWYVARRLRIEREVACDDRVLAAGADAPEYAGHLLELAYSWSGRRTPALVVGMASSRKLEGRMRAILDPARNRTAPSRRMWLAGAALSAALLLPLAAMMTADARSASADEPQSQERGAAANAAEQPIGSRDNVAGTWEIRPSLSREFVLLQVTAGPFSWNGQFPASEVDRLLSQSAPDAKGTMRVSVSREAGSLEIEGTLNDRTGSGTFRFVPSETFIAGLTRRGFSRPTAQQLFALAQNDIGFEFIDELAAQKYERPDLENLVRAAHHGVGTDFLREMGQAGYRVGTLDGLIRFRDHGVDADYVRGMRALGVSDLSPDDIVRARDHGVDPEYIAGLKSLGYSIVAFDMLIRARDHGIEGEYLRGMRQLGYSFTLDEAIRTRDHGVDPEFAGRMRTLGFTLGAEDLIRARDHGVDPEYVEDMALEGYKGVPIETLIRLRDHGVTADFVQEMRKRGQDKLTPDDIIRLRDRGDSPYERKLGQWNYHVDRLVAELERAIEKIIMKSQKAVDKSEKAIDKTQKAVDKLTR
jgi:beta-lactamase regulating signal transducer with metallopeptidase domain